MRLMKELEVISLELNFIMLNYFLIILSENIIYKIIIYGI